MAKDTTNKKDASKQEESKQPTPAKADAPKNEQKPKDEAKAQPKPVESAKPAPTPEPKSKGPTPDEVADALEKTGTGQRKLDLIRSCETVEEAIGKLREANQLVTIQKIRALLTGE